MKISLVHRFFWPDTPPYAVMLRHIAGRLADEGHDVTVISTQPSYKSDYDIETQPYLEEMDGFTVKRLKLRKENKSNIIFRIQSMFMFSLKLFIQLLKEKPDIIMIATTPPILGGLVVRYASKIVKADYIYHCQDIYPEVAEVSGHIKNNLLLKLLQKIDFNNCKHSKFTVVLSEDMKNSLLKRGCNDQNIVIINNFELVPFKDPNQKGRIEKTIVPSQMQRKKNKFRVLFAGNIGRFQGLETVLSVTKRLEHNKNIEFVFLGEGVAKKQLESDSGDLLNKTIFFFGHQPIEMARSVVADSQLCLITLIEGIYNFAFPSKTMTYMCEGIPVAVIAEKNSELSQTIMDNRLGVAVNPGNVAELASLIEELYMDEERQKQMKINVNNYSSKNFSLDAVLPKWASLFNDEKFSNGM